MCDIITINQELGYAKTYGHKMLDKKSVIDRHRYQMAVKFGVFVDKDRSKLPTLYWLPKLKKTAISHVLLLTLAHVLLLSCL